MNRYQSSNLLLDSSAIEIWFGLDNNIVLPLKHGVV